LKKLLEFRDIYEQLRQEAQRLTREINVKNINDAQIVQSLLEQRDFYLKHDLPSIMGLATKYDLLTSKLYEISTRYIEVEKQLNDDKKHLEKCGIKEITIGPKSISATGINNSQVYMTIQGSEPHISIKPENADSEPSADFVKYADSLKSELLIVLRKYF
jgi:hypothetical protein